MAENMREKGVTADNMRIDWDLPMRGSGPFTHTNPMDRPAEIFDNVHTVFGGANKGSYLLLPIIPSKA